MSMSAGSFTAGPVATIIVAADGTGDHTTIQPGIDALPADGGVVYIKEGTYEISAAIEIQKSNVAVMGAGRATLITLANGSDDHMIELGDDSTSFTGIVLTDVRLDGNSANQTGNLIGVYVTTAAEDCKVQRCWIDDVKRNGIYIDSGSDRNLISENTVTACTRDGIIVVGSTRGNVVSNNVSYSNTRNGIWVGSGSNIVEGNLCYSNGPDGSSLGAGIHIEFSGNLVVGNHCYDNYYGEIVVWTSTERNTITGNFCEASRGSGIRVFGDNNTITGNSVFNNDYRGISIEGADYNTVSGNVCMNNSQVGLGNQSSGILLSDANYNTISANQCNDDQGGSNTQKYGIEELDGGGDSDNNEIIGNVTVGNKTGTIAVVGAASEAVHNQ